MPLTKKDLENFLWKQPTECEQRGLALNSAFYRHGRRYQNLSLGSYGKVSLVHAQYWPSDGSFWLQASVFTIGSITRDTYEQGRRLQTALHDSLERANHAAGITGPICVDILLIGREVDTSATFLSTLKIDKSCRAFTYEHSVAGLRFKDVCKSWTLVGAEPIPVVANLTSDLRLLRQERIEIEQAKQAGQLRQAAQPTSSDYVPALTITSEGVLVNWDLWPGQQEGGDNE
jgi:hypothetical protein